VTTSNKRKVRITLLILTLNELEGMQVIVPRINRAWVDQIIVVDGGSDDGTISWAREHGLDVYVQQQTGFRHAYNEIWPQITGDAVITFSPDGNSIPELIPQLIDTYHDGIEMVIASRYLGDAVSEDDDPLTKFGNWFFTRIINLIHRGTYTDAMVIYRIYSRDLPERLGLHDDSGFARAESLFRTKISWEPLLSMRAARAGLRVKEIPGSEPARIGGERKLRPFKWGGAYLFQVLFDRWRYRIGKK